MRIELPFGKNTLTLSIPDRKVKEIVTKGDEQREIEREDIDLKETVASPLHGPTLKEIAKGKKVCLLVEDATRSEPHSEMIFALMAHLKTAKGINGILATGTHNPLTRENRAIMDTLARAAANYHVKLNILSPNSAFFSRFDEYGETSRGTPVKINAHLRHCDVVVIAADMKNHYFAGYSCAYKDILPGISSFDSIEKNHSFALDERAIFGTHPAHPDPSRRINPVAEDIVEAAEIVLDDKENFVLGVVSIDKKPISAFSGDIFTVTRRGIEAVDRYFTRRVEKTDYLVLSPGGFPQDESLYNAQRGLEMVRNALNPGAEVLMIAECSKGIAPSPDAMKFFYNPLLEEKLEDILSWKRENYRLYTHKAQRFARFLKDFRLHLHTSLGKEMVEAMGVNYVPDPQKLIDSWLRKDPKAEITIVDGGNKIGLLEKG